jgi:hypothetical protein
MTRDTKPLTILWIWSGDVPKSKQNLGFGRMTIREQFRFHATSYSVVSLTGQSKESFEATA